MSKIAKDIGTLSMSTLMALRDITRDDLRRTEKHKSDLEEILTEVNKEISSRGKQQSE